MTPRARRLGRGAVLAVLVAGAATTLAGCVLGPNALDGPIAIQLTVTATAEHISLDAPTWRAATSRVYVCPVDPPALPDPGPARAGWSPGPSCVDYGVIATGDGLRTALPTDMLETSSADRFATSEDWWVLIVEVDGDRAVQAVRSRFGRPAGWPPTG